MGKVIPDRKPKPVLKQQVIVHMHNGLGFHGEVEDPALFAKEVLTNGYVEQREDHVRVWPASAVANVVIYP